MHDADHRELIERPDLSAIRSIALGWRACVDPRLNGGAPTIILTLCDYIESVDARASAAARRAAELKRVAKAAKDWESVYRGRSISGKTLLDVCRELAEATAALGLESGEQPKACHPADCECYPCWQRRESQ